MKSVKSAGKNKTLFPLSSRHIHAARVEVVRGLAAAGHGVRAIRQILNLTGPEEARRLLAKTKR